ncbi:MAG: HEPN domain-containing protein [Betaproteobacteria bacterium]|nr:HEPN domain-containing protein [Betaproteobacteria bacterium]
MTDAAARREVAEYWVARADSALASAASEFAAARYDFAANRAYYACFYAASAVLLASGRKFTKHSGVRGAVHQDLVKQGLVEAKWGKAYDRLFETRHAADYVELFELEEAQVKELLELARGFVAEMKRLFDGGATA